MRAAVLVLLAAAGAPAQFRTTSTLVLAPTTVTTAEGKFVDGLQAADHPAGGAAPERDHLLGDVLAVSDRLHRAPEDGEEPRSEEGRRADSARRGPRQPVERDRRNQARPARRLRGAIDARHRWPDA